MHRNTSFRSAVLPALLLLTGCGSPDGRAAFSSPTEEHDAGPVTPKPGEFSEPGGTTGSVGPLRGVVTAPNGTIPIAGAVVYLTGARPEPAPERVYCDACVHLSAGTPHALSDERGAFEITPNRTGKQHLVVQKGGFRRVREIDVTREGATLSGALTRLPGKTDLTAGDEIPRMTVVHGQYDDIESSLEKLGVERSAIEIVESALIGVAARSFLTDRQRMDGRHIVFLPCGDYTQPPPNTDLSSDPQIQDNLRAFVEAGGRLYVTDWHYDFVAKTFPGYVSWSGGGSTPCSGCDRVAYDADARLDDPGLASWMTAQQLSSFTLQRNYTQIASLGTVTTSDGAGGTKTVTPRVWVSGSKGGAPVRPATVSFERGCGRVLFSSYHTEPSSLALSPQERALLGVLLEASVCNDSPTGVVIK